jgi:CDP-diacylglycerol--glycerol-3-phosphate 3-phosphatidyltransferase
MSANDLSPFVRDLLDDLRGDGFAPAAWGRFLFRAWEQSRATAKAHPALTRSWARSAASLLAVQAGVLAVEGLIGDSVSARRTAPGALLWMTWAGFDCWAHLGLAQAARGRPLQRAFGAANTLTLARRAIAGLLIGRLLIGRPATPRYTLLAAVAAVITDTVDGPIARRRSEVSRLGSYLDGMADLEIWTALTLTLAAQRLWPGWLTGLVLLRWLAPFAAAAGSYFTCSGVAFGSSRVGRITGVAQVVSVSLALMPKGIRQPIAGFRSVVYAVTAALMIATPLARVVPLWRCRMN